jgi:hypothetical protein
MERGPRRAVVVSLVAAFATSACGSSALLERGDRVRLESPHFETNPVEGRVRHGEYTSRLFKECPALPADVGLS